MLKSTVRTLVFTPQLRRLLFARIVKQSSTVQTSSSITATIDDEVCAVGNCVTVMSTYFDFSVNEQLCADEGQSPYDY